jgi:hypothetical protein
MTTLVPTAPAAIAAEAFVEAVVARDRGGLEDLLTHDVWLRSLLPRKTVEEHGRDAVLEVVHGWFGSAHEVRVQATYHHGAGGREHVGWRLLLRPDWEPDVWHLIEQLGYVRVSEAGIRRIDLVCTGFQPIEPDRPIEPQRVAAP